jgi:predicted MFS family arabinose efflux permease
MLFLASQFGAYFTYAYKTIGLSVKISDKTLSIASSASGLLQLFARVGFGTLYDRVGFKSIFVTIMII